MNINNKLAASLIFPIVFLAGLAVYKAAKISSGKEIVIPITGYDPRDLLSGHYLTFRLDLNNDTICGDEKYNLPRVYVCLRQTADNGISSNITDDISPEQGCDAVLKGKCEYGTFLAGIERYYIPEEHSAELDGIIRKGNGKIVISIDRKGKAAIKDLLIDGRPWREYLAGDQ
ncbi:MAG: GDYXXLXY domain-containing protein [Spirochaetes bacterium]|jgi:uncharacterized membrane-anchored protein|nr:GDYXXLXY domain-containing protein [Spirochaetota bacterium]